MPLFVSLLPVIKQMFFGPLRVRFMSKEQQNRAMEPKISSFAAQCQSCRVAVDKSSTVIKIGSSCCS